MESGARERNEKRTDTDINSKASQSPRWCPRPGREDFPDPKTEVILLAFTTRRYRLPINLLARECERQRGREAEQLYVCVHM